MTKRKRTEDMLSPWWTPVVYSISVNFEPTFILTLQLLYSFLTLLTIKGGSPYLLRI